MCLPAAGATDTDPPDGRLALVYMWPPSAPTTSEEAEVLLLKQFAEAGCTDIEARTMAAASPAAMVTGRR